MLHGFPATIFCTTQEKYLQDLATRCFTVTPEMTPEKYRAANMLTADKAAFPWMFDDDRDLEELRSYIRFLKQKLEEFRVVVPYAKAVAESFPNTFSRSMRDYSHIVNLMRVSAYFHFAQRPVLIREIIEDDETRQEFYVIAARHDYELVQRLWREVRETTETSAAGHIIKFYRQVVLEVAEEKEEFLVEDLTDGWNSKYENKKSSDVIGKWVRVLSDCGYLTRRRDPEDRRRKLIIVIQNTGKNRQYPLFELSEIFDLESFKEWVKQADKITSTNQVFLKEKFSNEKRTMVNDIYGKSFLQKLDSVDVNFQGGFHPSIEESRVEKTDFQKSGYYRDFQTYKQLVRLTTRVIDKCAVCGVQGRMDWQVTMHDGSWELLCDSCGLRLERENGHV